jgi:hypothetical protein
VSTSSFTLHSCLIGITGRMPLKCSSLSFSAGYSLIFCARIHWILLIWLDVRPGGQQHGAGAIPGTVVLDIAFCLEPDETRWSSLGNRTIRYVDHHELVRASILVSAYALGIPSCFAATSSRPFSASGFALSLVKVSLFGPVYP